MSWEIQVEGAGDVSATREVNRLAFGRGNEARLADDLGRGACVRLSLMAKSEGKSRPRLVQRPLHREGAVA